MKAKNILPWLMGLMLLTTATTTFTACSDDDDSKGNNGTEQTDSVAATYDDLAFFQEAICRIDSAGELVHYVIGEALYESEPQHLYIGVDNIEEAAKMFRCWMAPDVELTDITPTVSDLTAQLTDTLGRAQGTIYFRAGSGTTVAEVTYSPETQLKYIDKITFLQNSAWPYNSEALVWHKGDIRKFHMTGDCGYYLEDNDKELNFVLIREGGNGVKPIWCAITNNGYELRTPAMWKHWQLENIRKSNYCPPQAKAETIGSILRNDWDFFEDKFREAGNGALNKNESYWYNHTHTNGWATYYDVMVYGTGYTWGVKVTDIYNSVASITYHFLLNIDWIKDGDMPLRATAGTEITDDSFSDVRGSYHNLFDGLNDTWWGTNHLTWASQSNPLYWVEFEAADLIKPKGYVFVTSSKYKLWNGENPRPHNWKLYGKKRVRDEWTLIDQRANQNLPAESYKEVKYNLSNADGEYQYFRLEITDNQPWLLISEFKFTF